MVNKYITREIMVKIWKVVGQKIITKAGEKSLTSFVKMVPLVGVTVGFAFDWTATQIVGNVAIKKIMKMIKVFLKSFISISSNTIY